MAGMKIGIATAVGFLLVSSVAAGTIDDCPPSGPASDACKSCFMTTEISDALKDSTCVVCSESEDPWACLSCLTGTTEEGAKAEGCPECANGDLPYSCNSCLSAASTTDLAVEICPICATFDESFVGICNSCMLTPFKSEENKVYCLDCTDLQDFSKINECNTCLSEATDVTAAEDCFA
ncbi:hypothetical protein BSKO_05341 [Bryopsis sp. KO-2023]|nr:hypothetical protein BSKO_05341 [Bryopsis sp. KO-2023]